MCSRQAARSSRLASQQAINLKGEWEAFLRPSITHLQRSFGLPKHTSIGWNCDRLRTTDALVPQFDTFAVINICYDSCWYYQKPQQTTVRAARWSWLMLRSRGWVSMKPKRGTKTFRWYWNSDACSLIGCFVSHMKKRNRRLRTHRIFSSFSWHDVMKGTEKVPHLGLVYTWVWSLNSAFFTFLILVILCVTF